MNNTIYRLLLFTAFLIFIGLQGCQRKEDIYFTKPINLEGSIYKTLQSKGNFTNYLKCLDRTPYASALAKSGSWTVFVPNDDAFKKYLEVNHYSSVEDIPYQKVSEMIKFSIITDACNTTTLTFYKDQWYEGSACRRRTQLKDTVVLVDSKNYPSFQMWKDRKYLINPRGGRLVPTTYFIQSYFDAQPLETADYAFMFPGETYQNGDMKVLNAHVLEKNVIAENGMIFVLDKVLDPLPNIYQNLLSDKNVGKYTIFKKMIDRFGSFTFSEMLKNNTTGVSDSVFRLSFQTGIASNYLAFDPNEENYPMLKAAIDYTSAFAVGMFAPTDQALINYLKGNNLVSRYYSSYDDMPLDLLGIFLNINFVVDFWSVCPSKYNNVYNVGFEKIDIQTTDVLEKKFCSNGLFVGINKVFTSNSFATVMGPMLLDSSYSIMLKEIKDLQIDKALKSKGIDYSVIGLKNTQIINMPDPNSPFRKISIFGYTPNLSQIYLKVTGDPIIANNRIYPNPSLSIPSPADVTYVNTTLKSIFLNQIIEAPINLSVDNYYETKSGEFVNVTNGTKISGGGNIAAGTSVSIDSKIETSNGNFFMMNGPVIRPTRYTYGALKDNPNEFSKFLMVLDGADVKVAIPDYSSDFLIGFLDLRKSYTLLAPNNAAVQKAIDDNVILNPDPVFLNKLSPIDKANAKIALQNFAKKHFIQKAITTDGSTTGTFSSLYIDKVIDFIPIYRDYTIQNSISPMRLDIKNSVDGTLIAKTGGKINILSKMVVIHEIDSYLK
jgi:hypothetical protein